MLGTPQTAVERENYLKEIRRRRFEEMKTDRTLKQLQKNFNYFLDIAPLSGFIEKGKAFKPVYPYKWRRVFAFNRMQIKNYLAANYPEFYKGGKL